MADLQRPSNPKADMPVIAAWIDELRAALGKDMIDKAVRDGLKNGGFWAIEQGFVIGTPPPDAIRAEQRRLDDASRLANTAGQGSPDAPTADVESAAAHTSQTP